MNKFEIAVASNNISGYMSLPDLCWLAETAENKTVLELGSWEGRSSFAIASTCHKVVCVDCFGDDTYNAFMQNTIDFRQSGKMIVERMNLNGGREILLNKYGINSFDMIFIDEDHSYNSIMKDIHMARNLVRPGGIISGHDYTLDNWPEIIRAVDESFGKIHRETKITNLHNRKLLEETYSNINIKIPANPAKYNLGQDCIWYIPNNKLN